MKKDFSRPALPKSLRKKQIKRVLFRVIPCILLLGIMIVVIVVWGSELFHMPGKGYEAVQKVIYLFLLLLPFLITGVPLKLIDTSWDGTIMDVKIEESVGTYTVGGRPWPYSRQDLILKITKDNEKTVEYTVLSLGIKDKPWNNVPIVGKIEYHAEKYHVGERVHKYYGFKHLYRRSNDGKICIVCGAMNQDEETVCGLCHSELII